MASVTAHIVTQARPERRLSDVLSLRKKGIPHDGGCDQVSGVRQQQARDEKGEKRNEACRR